MGERRNRAGGPDKSHDESASDSSSPAPLGASPEASVPRPHRPTRMFRRRLKPSRTTGRPGFADSNADVSPTTAATELGGRAPRVLSLAGAALTVGVAAGFLELAAVFGQLYGLHQVRWSSLMINRHAAWMIPAAETLLVAAWTLALVGPVLAWAAWARRRSATPSAEPGGTTTPGAASNGSWDWTWGWSGWVLGTLLLFGSLLSIPGLHPVAVVTLAVGLGYRLRGWVVRPTATWERGACWSGAAALVVLAGYGLVQANRVAAAPAQAWSRPKPAAALAPASDGPAPNLLWIVMDTVRADHLSLYGYPRPTTPRLSAWGEQGITFDMARSAAPWTLPAHMTMFTGLWPYQHGARVDRPYHGTSPMLAEHLNAHGYTTAGIVANVRVCNAHYGFGRGFDHYVDYPQNQQISLNETVCNSTFGDWTMNLLRRARLPVPNVAPFFVHRQAREIIAEAQGWLDQVDRRNAAATTQPDAGGPRPYFLFLNFMDVHGPYLPTADASQRKFWTGPVPSKAMASPNGGWAAVRTRDNAPPAERPRHQQTLNEVTQRLTDLYDECILGLDAELGRFLDDLRQSGRLDNTWVVVTGDHGEHLGEHGHFGHGSSLYNELTHVPLLIIPPLKLAAAGAATGTDAQAPIRNRRIAAPVAHRDLPRTFADLLLPRAANPFPGRSLARHWTSNEPQTPDPILAQLVEQPLDGQEVNTEKMLTMDSVVDEDHVFIDVNLGKPELYHLFNDRKQEVNLVEKVDERPRRDRLTNRLETLRKAPANESQAPQTAVAPGRSSR